MSVILIVFLIPIIASSLLNLKQKRENKIAEQKILAEEQAKKDAAEKIYLLGQFDPSQNTDFSVIPSIYGISGYTMYLRKETLDAFLQMADAAEEDGVSLKIASATRNFDYQQNLWNDKWNDFAESVNGITRFQTILKYSAAPGTSRHHWGTDIDINDANPQYFDTEDGKEVYAWMEKNAVAFGFCQPYTVKESGRSTGYNEEKWHWSYIPLSKGFTRDYKRLITNEDIEGFNGDEYSADLDLINNYVLGINPGCL